MAASATGRQLAAPAYQTGIYLSTNYGSSWRLTSAPPMNWQAIASSADGSNLVATTGVLFTINPNHYGPIFLSTDGGAHWTQSGAPTNTWASVASSADGHAVFAVANGGGIYTFHTTPAPALNVGASEPGISLSWTIPSIRLRLQQTTDLATANWTDVPMPPTPGSHEPTRHSCPAPGISTSCRVLSAGGALKLRRGYHSDPISWNQSEAIRLSEPRARPSIWGP